MGLRYRIPFKDCKNTSYEVRIYKNGYTGEEKELVGAPSCFVISGTDEDFIYTPVRTSTATISVLDSDLLLDLYSINNQYAPVKFYKDGVLEWTGYIKPEQFTQPYVNGGANVSVECVGALATLENITYKESEGFISVWDLMKLLVKSTNGGYRGVHIPWVYGKDSSMSSNVLAEMVLVERNFTENEMNMLEVLEAVCKLLNWTVYDIGGFLWFIDSDFKGSYRLYDEDLETFLQVKGNDVLLQDVGYNGSESNTIDVVPGYNRASVKAINHVFNEVVTDEDYDVLEKLKDYFVQDGKKYWYKRFLQPKVWEVYSYNRYKQIIGHLTAATDVNKDYFGAVLLKEAVWEGKEKNGVIYPGVSEYPWSDCIQMRSMTVDGQAIWNDGDIYPVFRMKGANTVWGEGAISVNGQMRVSISPNMRWGDTAAKARGTILIRCMLRIGVHYWSGSGWTDAEVFFYLPFETSEPIGVDEYMSIRNTKTPDMPYNGLNGYIIPLPESPMIGDLEFTMLAQDFNEPIGGFGTDWPFYQEVKIYGVTLKGLSFKYAKKDGTNDEGENGDRIYENVVNENYMSDADEIEFDISSYNADGSSFSKVMMGEGWLTNNLFYAVVGEMVRPEELMIRRIVNRYGETKIKLTEAICMTGEISPITRIKERSMVEKTFRLTSGEWDYEQNKLTLQIQEDV